MTIYDQSVNLGVSFKVKHYFQIVVVIDEGNCRMYG